ncbi:MAG: hypothetical protein CM1200mP26_15170 [Acidimicrobiales bacterium]|nr:MAG: hypothetical protein CM1200mP26_15170 [Acidimicrobiales bacterium]
MENIFGPDVLLSSSTSKTTSGNVPPTSAPMRMAIVRTSVALEHLLEVGKSLGGMMSTVADPCGTAFHRPP